MKLSKNKSSYDDWKLHTPDNDLKLFCYCDLCGGEIYIGEEYYYADGKEICAKCYESDSDYLQTFKKVAE